MTHTPTSNATHIQITISPDRMVGNIVEDLIEELGFHTVKVVGNVISGSVSGSVRVGGLGSGSVDLDGLDIGVIVDCQSVMLRTTLYAKDIESIMVNNVEMHPLSQMTSFPDILDESTRKVFDSILASSFDLLTSIVEGKTIDITNLARALAYPETHRVFMSLASLSEQGQERNSGFKNYLEDFFSTKTLMINGLRAPHTSEFRTTLELFISQLKMIGEVLIPDLEAA